MCAPMVVCRASHNIEQESNYACKENAGIVTDFSVLLLPGIYR